MRSLLMILTVFVFTACPHHHKGPEHHHHDGEKCAKCVKKTKDVFEHKCAYSLMEGDMHTEGKEEFSLEHGNERYYFSSAEKLEAFKKSLQANIDAAHKRWEGRGRR